MRRRFPLFLVLACSALAVLAWPIWRYCASVRDVERLFGGSNEVSLVSLECDGTEIDESGSVEYLSAMFRCSELGSGEGQVPWSFSEFGLSHHANLRLSTGRS